MSEQTATGRREPHWLIPTVAAAVGLFYAYAVWNAVGFLVAQATTASGLNGAGWALLSFAVAFPIIVFAAAAILGRRQSFWRFGLILLAGLGLVAVFWLNVLAYAFTSGQTLIAG
jgi:hypothetical protein